MTKSSSSLMTGPSRRTSGLEPNIAAVLSYLVMVPPITPAIMLLLEKEDRYVRFHALQGLLLGVLALVGIFGLEMIAQAVGFVSRPLEIILNIAIFLSGAGTFFLWIYLLIRAYQAKSVKVPIVGDEAARRVWREQ